MNKIKAIKLARKHKLKKRGIVYPVTTVEEADRAGISLSLACAVLMQESAGGHNVFGHDPVRNIRGGQVTRARYELYRRQRKAGLGMQGVGPCQLTWWEFQDAADKLGGCWKPRYNIRVGFTRLGQLIKEHGKNVGIARYNGTGNQANTYSREVRAREAHWHELFRRD